jgi:hypothetical protein
MYMIAICTRASLHRSALVRLALAATLIACPFSAVAQVSANPFGPNVVLLDPHRPTADMQADIDRIYSMQQHSEFGPNRYAILLKPGDYTLDIPVGFYTQVLGVGATPDAVMVAGNVHADASLPRNNATCTFWRSAEGFAVHPSSGTMQWAVSQAVALRRMHISGNLVLHQNRGWASGGWFADSVVDGTVDSGTQQQWISRNVEWNNWTGSNWNMVFVGVNRLPEGEWPKPPFTKIATAPVTREKPFLTFNEGAWSIVVPALQHNTSGITWHAGSTPGRTFPLSTFYIAQAGKDTAATLNAALKRGKNLLFTPGVYDLDDTLLVSRKDTVVYGLGLATLRPTTGKTALHVDDRDGINVSGLLFDAGLQLSPSLLEIGTQGRHRSHTTDPISLHNVFFRVGGADAGNVAANLIVNADDTLIDHTWIWRADHGKGVGWTTNRSDNGIIVNGNNITVYGLFVEHHQQYQVLWNGEHGRVYFYQSEIPYDPPTQSVWKSTPDTNGWASYKVSPSVRDHEAWGLGIYSVFLKPDVELTRAMEVPDTPGVRFHHIITTALARLGAIDHVINDTGERAHPDPKRNTPKLDEYPVTAN